MSSFLEQHRRWLLGFLIAVLVFIVAYAIVEQVRAKKIDTTTVLAEKAQDLYQSLLTTTDAKTQKQMASQLLSSLDEILKKYPNQYAGQRALFVRGSYYYHGQQWDKSAADFKLLAKRFPKSYLAPISLVNAAMAMEEKGDYQASADLYKQVVAQYKDSSPEIAGTLFSLGRVYEEMKNSKEALATYKQLVDQYPSSNWTNLAQDRIIVLGIQGGS